MGSAVLELMSELLDLNKILIVILVLLGWVISALGCMVDMSYLEVLPWDLNIVESGVLEINQVVAEKVERLFTGLGVKEPFVTIPPVLQSAQVLVVRQRGF